MRPVAPVPSDPRVLRASPQRYRRWLRGSLASGAGIAVLLVAAQVRRVDSVLDVLLLGGLLVATPVVALTLVAVHVRTSSVTIVGGRVEYRRWGRCTVLYAGDELVGLLAVYRPTMTNGPATPVLVARAADGGPRIHLSGAHWEQADLDQIARTLRIPVRDRVLNAKGYERRAPGAMPWRERHWALFGTGAAVVVVALIVAGVLVYYATQDLPPFDDAMAAGVRWSTT